MYVVRQHYALFSPSQEWQTRQRQQGRKFKYVWNKDEFDAIDPENTDYAMGKA